MWERSYCHHHRHHNTLEPNNQDHQHHQESEHNSAKMALARTSNRANRTPAIIVEQEQEESVPMGLAAIQMMMIVVVVCPMEPVVRLRLKLRPLHKKTKCQRIREEDVSRRRQEIRDDRMRSSTSTNGSQNTPQWTIKMSGSRKRLERRLRPD